MYIFILFENWIFAKKKITLFENNKNFQLLKLISIFIKYWKKN